MDDPIFGPWGADSPEAEPRASNRRWRSPLPPAPPVPPPSTAAPTAGDIGDRVRLAGKRGYVRSMAVPRMQAAVLRLQLARHEAALEDHLEDAPPLLRLTMRPWRTILARTPPPPFATLEIELEEGAEDCLAARMWLDPTVKPAGEARMALSRVTAGWVEQTTLEFVAKVLARG